MKVVKRVVMVFILMIKNVFLWSFLNYASFILFFYEKSFELSKIQTWEVCSQILPLVSREKCHILNI